MGGDDPYQPPRDNPQHDDFCRLLGCLLSEKNLSVKYEEKLEKSGVDLHGIRHCLREYCRRRRGGAGE